MQIDLSGRAAVVTGGSRGIGLAIASRFAASGADIAIVANDGIERAKAAFANAPGRAVFVHADVSRAEDIQRAYDEIMGALGKIDVVVNNAGTLSRGAFEDLTDERWREDLELKLFAAIRLIRLAWPQMKARRWGRVINVLNLDAKAPRAGSMPTSVSRAAGMALTKALAGEGAPSNILVNALLVGVIETDQWRQVAGQEGIAVSDLLARLGKTVPLGRVGQPQEFANLACFLASDAASYITGTAINVDGGRSPVV